MQLVESSHSQNHSTLHNIRRPISRYLNSQCPEPLGRSMIGYTYTERNRHLGFSTIQASPSQSWGLGGFCTFRRFQGDRPVHPPHLGAFF